MFCSLLGKCALHITRIVDDWTVRASYVLGHFSLVADGHMG